jgi:hypothetical protein
MVLVAYIGKDRTVLTFLDSGSCVVANIRPESSVAVKCSIALARLSVQ